MQILIVDDEPGTRLTVASVVRRLGHEVVEASDGADGWRRFSQDRPQVVITDWAMPGLDGTELTRRIRALAGGDYTYIMVLSARADEDAQRDAVRAGADDVLVKPPDPAELERGLIAAERLVTLHRRITDDARRDPLTGAGSRLRLDEDLAALCARVTRYGHAYSVAMVGVRGDGADDVQRAGAALAREIRSGDVLYRFGPSQFVVLLPEQALDTANLAANRLQSAAERAGAAVDVAIVTTGSEPEPAALLVTGGAGGVGSILVQLARCLTGLTVVATASRPESRAWCLELGAHHVVDHTQPLGPQLQALALPPVRYAASLTHTPQHFKALVEALAPQGRLAAIDDFAGSEVDVMALKGKSLSFHWEMMFTRSLFQTPDMAAQGQLLAEVAALVDAGRLRSTLTQTLGPIDAAHLKRAHALVESGRMLGKVVLEGYPR